MSDDAYGATIAKRKLARRLAELRKANGYTANHVCDILNWGRGKVGRFEANLWRRPEMSDIRDLLRIYEVDQDEGDELEELAVKARARAWWRDYPEVYPNEFPGFENDARRIRVFMPLVLPGLLQTREYVEALTRAGQRPPLWRRRALETRLRRQEILDRTDGSAPELIAVITEASLLYRWGTRTDRRDQIVHLAELSHRPNVELRIQRFGDGPPAGAHSMVNIFDFPGDEPRIVYLESDYAIHEVDDSEEVSAYIQSFGQAVDGSLEPPETTAYLNRLAEQME
jgi:transcriptional regulator with XRE-family HTH domain